MRLVPVAAAGLSAVAVPFVMTGIYRVLDGGIPISALFAVFVLVGLAMLRWPITHAVGTGWLIGTAAHAVFVLAVFVHLANADF